MNISENYRTEDTYEDHFVIKLLLVSKIKSIKILKTICFLSLYYIITDKSIFENANILGILALAFKGFY